MSEVVAILARMSYDEELAGRIRAVLSFTEGVTEQRMFGGVGFMVAGHMVAAASRSGDMMVRLDPALAAELIDGERVRPFIMNGREPAGWLSVEPEAVEGDQLRLWLERGVAFVRTLPAKERPSR